MIAFDGLPLSSRPETAPSTGRRDETSPPDGLFLAFAALAFDSGGPVKPLAHLSGWGQSEAVHDSSADTGLPGEEGAASQEGATLLSGSTLRRNVTEALWPAWAQESRRGLPSAEEAVENAVETLLAHDPGDDGEGHGLEQAMPVRSATALAEERRPQRQKAQTPPRGLPKAEAVQHWRSTVENSSSTISSELLSSVKSIDSRIFHEVTYRPQEDQVEGRSQASGPQAGAQRTPLRPAAPSAADAPVWKAGEWRVRAVESESGKHVLLVEKPVPGQNDSTGFPQAEPPNRADAGRPVQALRAVNFTHIDQAHAANEALLADDVQPVSAASESDFGEDAADSRGGRLPSLAAGGPVSGPGRGRTPSKPGSSQAELTAFTPGAARGPRSANPDTAGNRLPGTPSEPGDPSRADAVEELLERARLERNAKGPELRVVLNDDRLGRVAVHAAGRNGWVNASVRTDSPQTARLIEQTSAEVAESLARKGFVAEAHGATSEGAYREQEQEHERRRSMANSPMRTRYRTRGSGQDFAASLNALPR